MGTDALIARLEGLGDAARIVAKVAPTDTARSHARGLAAGYYAAAELLRDNAATDPAPFPLAEADQPHGGTTR